MKLLTIGLGAILLTGCSVFSSPKPQLTVADQLINCTIKVTKDVQAHVIDSADICRQAYQFEKHPHRDQVSGL